MEAQWKVAGYIFNLTGLDIFLLNLWQRLTDVSAAEGSLKIRELYKSNLSVFISFEMSALDAHNDILGFRGRSLFCLQEILDLPQFFLNIGLPFFE
jgi:hypothetical protein